MRIKLRSSISVIALAVTGGLMSVSCAAIADGKPLAAGDKAGVHFTCRLKSGEIAISTLKEVAENPSLPKSVVFVPREETGPLPIQVGGEMSGWTVTDMVPFEDRVSERIAATLVGMKPGEKRTIRITAEHKDKDAHGEDNKITLNRVLFNPKEITWNKSDFVSRTGKSPVAGEELDMGDGMDGRVLSVNGDKVTLKLLPRAGTRIKTPFGPGKVRETKDGIETVIEVKTGSLLRSGPLVGRVEAVDDRSFTIDYGHPFGGEELSCDVTVEPTKGMAKQGEGNAKQ